MRFEGKRPVGLLAAALVLLVAFGTAGCGLLGPAAPVEEGAIEPALPAGASDDLGLGPGVRPLSLGPGDKSSPRISPSGDRVAFVLDGYAVDKPLYTQDLRRRTAKGFRATGADWVSEESLAVLGHGIAEDAGASEDEGGALYVVPPGGSSETVKLTDEAQAAGAQANAGSLVAAVDVPVGGAPTTMLLRARSGGGSVRLFPVDLRGRVSGLSLSPDGREAVLALQVRSGEDAGRFELVAYRFAEGAARRAALLDEGMEVVGPPQWTTKGIYFVAGEKGDEEADYSLYHLPASSSEYEPERGLGEDFVPASIAASPDGESLAVLGRRNASSPTDLYVLDLASNALDAVTANENMEFKTKPRDLSWSPDGSYVLVVARGVQPAPRIYGSPAQELSSAFYNIYAVPVGEAARSARGRRAG